MSTKRRTERGATCEGPAVRQKHVEPAGQGLSNKKDILSYAIRQSAFSGPDTVPLDQKLLTLHNPARLLPGSGTSCYLKYKKENKGNFRKQNTFSYNVSYESFWGKKNTVKGRF